MAKTKAGVKEGPKFFTLDSFVEDRILHSNLVELVEVDSLLLRQRLHKAVAHTPAPVKLNNIRRRQVAALCQPHESNALSPQPATMMDQFKNNFNNWLTTASKVKHSNHVKTPLAFLQQ